MALHRNSKSARARYYARRVLATLGLPHGSGRVERVANVLDGLVAAVSRETSDELADALERVRGEQQSRDYGEGYAAALRHRTPAAALIDLADVLHSYPPPAQRQIREVATGSWGDVGRIDRLVIENAYCVLINYPVARPIVEALERWLVETRN